MAKIKSLSQLEQYLAECRDRAEHGGKPFDRDAEMALFFLEMGPSLLTKEEEREAGRATARVLLRSTTPREVKISLAALISPDTPAEPGPMPFRIEEEKEIKKWREERQMYEIVVENNLKLEFGRRSKRRVRNRPQELRVWRWMHVTKHEDPQLGAEEIKARAVEKFHMSPAAVKKIWDAYRRHGKEVRKAAEQVKAKLAELGSFEAVAGYFENHQND